MARLPYADLATAPQALVERIIAERGSVLHLYQMLLHSPPLAEGWLAFFTAVRQRSTLPGALRELVIMRVALLNRAPYEADQHAPIARREGVSEQQLAELALWEASAAFSPQQRAVLALTDGITRDVQVPEALMHTARGHLADERQMVELVATIAGYNLVSRFLEAFQIHSHDPR
ncbi:MAG: carboxymuconolactone decarboxylase family protein [Rubrivivax sp.]|nr:carboxymuconolactone decarboxylase family protein [Rubrivivax sp.]